MIHMTKAKMERLPIPLPPLTEQSRIVAKVDELMALIDELERARDDRDASRAEFRDSTLAALENVEDAEAARAAWSRIAANIDHLFTDPADIAPLRQTILQLAVLGRLARHGGFTDCSFGEVVEIYGGCAFKSEWYERSNGIRCVRNQNVGHGRLDWSDTVRVPESRASEFARFSLAEGDLVLSLNRPFINTGLKLSWIRLEDLPSFLVQRVARLRPDHQRLLPQYLYLWCIAPHFYRDAHIVPSSGVPYISPKRVAQMQMRLPSLAEQRRVVAKVDELMSICDELEQRLTEAKTHQSAFAAAAVHHLDPSSGSSPSEATNSKQLAGA